MKLVGGTMVVLGGLGVLQGIVTTGSVLSASYVTNPNNPSQTIQLSAEQRFRAIAGTVIMTGASVLLLYWGSQIYNKKSV
jgi:hypothetical protein